MNTVYLTAGIIALLVVIFGVGSLQRRRKPHLNVQYFQKKWQEVQALCASKETWPLAIINGDKLIDEALKKNHFKGKSMGERLVSAQRSLTNNDTTWFCHKLRNRLVHENDVKLKERDVKSALVGVRQALKDLGALN